MNESPGPFVISIQKKDNNAEYIKCMMRTPYSYTRIWMNNTEGSHNKMIKNHFPFLENVKLQKIKKSSLSVDLAEMEQSEMQTYKYYKFGVLYMNDKIREENDFFGVTDIESQDWKDFLAFLGEEVKLKGFNKFNGGLDTI